mgnify:FL=1
MNRTYIEHDQIQDTKTIINIQIDGFEVALSITKATSNEIDVEYKYSGARVVFHRLVKTLIHLYEMGNYALAGLYEYPFKDLLDTWYSDAELKHLMEDYEVNDPIDLIDILLKEGAFKTLRCAFKMN